MAETAMIPQKFDAAAAKRVLVMGATGSVYVLVSDGLLDDRFADSESPELVRGLIQIGVGLALAKLISKKNRDAAIGVGVGGAVSGGIRLLKHWQVDTDLRNALRGENTTNTTTTTTTTGTDRATSGWY
jgi:hypothetical protein